MKRINFVNYFPTDLSEDMLNGVSIRSPKFRYVNKMLRDRYGAKIKKEDSRYGEYYIIFKNDEDMVAFKLAYGF
jgi:hypothetical protein